MEDNNTYRCTHTQVFTLGNGNTSTATANNSKDYNNNTKSTFFPIPGCTGFNEGKEELATVGQTKK